MVLDDTRTDLDPEALRGLLVEQVSKSKEFESEVRTLYREEAKRTYQFLMRSIDLLLPLKRTPRSRQQQVATQGRHEQEDNMIAAPSLNEKRSGTPERGCSCGRRQDSVGSRGSAALRLPDRILPTW